MNKKLLLLAALSAVSSFAQLIPSAGTSSSSNITQIGGASLSLGQKSMSASLPVAIASDQSALPVSIAATLANNISQIGGTAISLGAKTSTASFPVVLATDQAAIAVTMSGNQAVNLAQVGGTAISLGQKTMSASLPVVLPSDQAMTSAPKTSCGSAAYSTAFQPAATTLTTLTGTTTCLNAIIATNTGATTLGITVQDGGTNQYISNFNVPANSTAIFPMYYIPSTGGVKAVASGAGLTIGLSGWQ